MICKRSSFIFLSGNLIHRYLKKTGIILILIFFCCISRSDAQQNTNRNPYKPSRILFLLDASGSMRGKWQNNDKWITANQILRQMVDSLRKQNIEFALRVFGHQSDKELNDCQDTKLEIPFSSGNVSLLNPKLNSISPKGYSPIALSLEKAIGDFPSNADTKNIIILITDGFENCEGDPCVSASKLQSAGVFLKPYIVGLGLSEEQKAKFDCVGELYDVKETNAVDEISGVIISNVLNPTTLQINLLSEGGRPSETNVNMSFSETTGKQIKYNLIHTLNSSGNPDTLYIDPSKNYDVKIHTLPPVKISNIQLIQGKHTIKAADAPQGTLKLSMPGAMKYKNLKCIIRKNSEKQILNIQDINSSSKYITGNYDVEVLTVPLTILKDISITQSQVKSISIVSPGALNISKAKPGYLWIMKNNSGILEKVYTVDIALTKETILIQPGNYELIYRSKNAHSSKSSVSKKISIVSGTNNTINF